MGIVLTYPMKSKTKGKHHKTDHLGAFCIECIEFWDEEARKQMYKDLKSGKVTQKALF